MIAGVSVLLWLLTQNVAGETSARQRPVRPVPVIRRIPDSRCLVVAPGAVLYEEDHIVRPIDRSFPCNVCWLRCFPHAGDGSRLIYVTWRDGTRESIPERWPDDPGGAEKCEGRPQ